MGTPATLRSAALAALAWTLAHCGQSPSVTVSSHTLPGPATVATYAPKRLATDAAAAQALAASLFQVTGAATAVEGAWVVEANGRRVAVRQDGSGVSFVDAAGLSTGGALGTEAAAVTAATALVTRAGGMSPEVTAPAARLLPGPSGAPRAWRVRFEVRLGVATLEGQALTGRVSGLTNVVEVGPAGAIVGAELAWFGLTPGTTPPSPALPVTVDGVAAALRLPAAQIAVHYTYQALGTRLVPFYVFGPKGVPIELLELPHSPFASALAPATADVPVAMLDADLFESHPQAGKPIALSAVVAQGTPPYTVAWWSDRVGPLGTGNPLTVRLPPGLQAIEAVATDAAGRKTLPVFHMLDVVGNGTPDTAPVTPPKADGSEHDSVTSRLRARWRHGPPEVTANDGIRVRDIDLVDDFGVSYGGSPLQMEYPHATRVVRELTTPSLRYRATFTVPGLPPIVAPEVRCQLQADGAPCATAPGASISLVEPPKVEPNGNIRARYRLTNLPGTLLLDYRYDFSLAGFCVPGHGGFLFTLMTTLTMPNRLSGLKSGRCNAFRPEIVWTYVPPKCVNVATILGLCKPNGEWSCAGITEADLKSKEGGTGTVEDFRLTLFTRILPFAEGELASAVMLSDGPYVPKIPTMDRFDGKPLCSKRDSSPGWNALLGKIADVVGLAGIAGELFCPFEPMATEAAPLLARGTGQGHEPVSTALPLWDNLHLKARLGPIVDPATGKAYETPYVFFPQGNDTLEPRDANLCFHIHERWPDSEASGQNFGRGQDVRYLIAADRPGEADPPDPEALTDSGDALADGRIALWLVSEASSRHCTPAFGDASPGEVGNFLRPCHAFSAPIFTSGPHASPPHGAPEVASGFVNPLDVITGDLPAEDCTTTPPPPDDDPCLKSVFACKCDSKNIVSPECDAGCAKIDPGLKGYCKSNTCGLYGCGDFCGCACYSGLDAKRAAAGQAYCDKGCDKASPWPVGSCSASLTSKNPDGCTCFAK